MIPFFLLAEHARRRVTVALSGDGADELLAGYMTYRASRWSPYYRALPRWLRRGLIEPAARRLPVSTAKYGAPSLARRFVAAASLPFPLDHCSWRRIVPADLREELYAPSFRQQLTADPLQCYADVLEDAPDWASPLEQQLHLDLRFHLPNDMLVKVDRMSMAHSLEVRVPFLDLEVVAACLAMPPECKHRRGRGKLPLKALLAKDLPPELVHRKKGGFLAPIESWLRGPWQPLVKELLNRDFAEESGLFSWPALARMIADHAAGRGDHAYPLFTLLVLALWWETWLTGATAPQPQRRRSAAPVKVHRLLASESAR